MLSQALKGSSVSEVNMWLHTVRRRTGVASLAAALGFVMSTAAFAQSIVDPRTAEFAPSADHNALAANGTPLVTRYDLGFYLIGAAQPFQVSSIGKPTPAADGLIHFSLSSLTSMPSPGVVYESRVSAVGPGGSAPSGPSNSFMFSVPCTYTVSAAASASATGGAGTLSVTTGAGCAWTAASNAAWLTIASGAAGTGSGSVGYSVAANAGTALRTGTLTVAGQTITVSQSGLTCSYSASPATQSTSAAGGSLGVAVTAATGCAWTATSAAAWLTIASGATGSGNGTIGLQAAANPATTARTGTVSVGGQVVSVTQPGSACAFTATPTATSFGSAAGSGSVTVTSTSGCAWTAASSATWLTVTSGASGSGSGAAAFSVAANATTSARVGSLTVAGQVITISQAALACAYTLSPAAQTAPAAGGALPLGVAAASGCTWTATSNAAWLHVTSTASGSGSGSLTLGVDPNLSSLARTGSISLGGQSAVVTQAGGTCTFSVNPTAQSAGGSAGTGSVAVTTLGGCNWSSSSAAPWLTITSGASGNGPGSMAYAIAANPTTSPRSGTLTVAGQLVTVTQAAAPCTFTVSPTSQALPAAGGSASGLVATAAGCTWTATSPASWLTISGGATGSGAGTFSFAATPNPGTAGRSATLMVAGASVLVTQPAVGCNLTVTPTSLSVGDNTNPSTLTVSGGAGCEWSAVSQTSWLQVTAGSPGVGPGTVTITQSLNPGSTIRTGTLLVAGQVVTVTQNVAGAPKAPGGIHFVATP